MQAVLCRSTQAQILFLHRFQNTEFDDCGSGSGSDGGNIFTDETEIEEGGDSETS